MVEIIRLNNDPHAEAQQLLPWYVTGELNGEELAQVEAHLSECVECREDLAMERAMAREIHALPRDVERGWTALKARVDGRLNAPSRTRLLGRRVSLSWALALQAASLAIIVTIMILMFPRPNAAYRALGSAPSAASGNLIVMFKPDASEATLRMILKQNQARIVDGPTSADAYVLHVAANERAAVLARLRGDRNISLAVPIDGDNR